MIRTEQSVDVPRPPAESFAFLDDASRTPSWMGMCTKLEQTSPAPKRVGSTMHYAHNQGSNGGSMDGVVTEYEPGRRLTMKFTDKMFEVVVALSVEPRDAGTRIGYVLEITPLAFLAKMMTPMIGKASLLQTAKDASSLKELLSS